MWINSFYNYSIKFRHLRRIKRHEPWFKKILAQSYLQYKLYLTSENLEKQTNQIFQQLNGHRLVVSWILSNNMYNADP